MAHRDPPNFADAARRLGRRIRGLWRSVGVRFAVVVTLVIVVSVGLLTINGIRLLDANLVKSENKRIDELRALMSATIAPHMAHDDLDTASAELLSIRKGGGLAYVVLLDIDQRILAADGWPADRGPAHR